VLVDWQPIGRRCSWWPTDATPASLIPVVAVVLICGLSDVLIKEYLFIYLFSQCNDNDDEYTSVLCAVCAEANDDLVIPYNVVDCLLNKQTQTVCVTTAISNTDDDSDNDVNITVDVNDESNDNQTVINADDVETQHVMNETVDAMNGATESSRASNSADVETMHDEQLNDDTL